MNQQGGDKTDMDKVYSHLKDRNHVWVIILSSVTAGLYLWHAIVGNAPQQQLIANLVLTIIAAITVSGGLIALIVMGLLKAEQCGELKEFRTLLTLGLLVSVGISAVGLLTLFGLANST